MEALEETFYTTKESISSPVKSVLQQQQQQQNHQNEAANESELTSHDAQQQQSKWQHLYNATSSEAKKVKTYLGQTFDKLKARFEEKKQEFNNITRKNTEKSTSPAKRNFRDREQNESKIFVTRSSKEFAQIKLDGNLTTNSSSSTATQGGFAYPLVGASIVALPYALKQSGLLLGVLLIFFVVVALDYSEYLLVQSSSSSEQKHIPTLAKEMFGRFGYLIYFTVPYLFQFCILLSYFIILGDVATKCLKEVLDCLPLSITIHRNVALLLILFAVVPTSLLRNTKRVYPFSFSSLVVSTLLMVLVIVRLFTLSDHLPHVSEIYHPFKYLGTNIVQAVSVATFTLSCQHSSRLAYMRVSATKEYDVNKPADLVAAYVLLSVLVISSGGYTTFTMFTQGNILENYCEEDVLASVVRLCHACFTVYLFPLECQNIRLLTDELLAVHQRFKRAFHVTVTVLILLPLFVAALLIECLPLVLETAGVLFAIPMVFVLPPVLFMRVFPGRIWEREKLPCLVFACLGIALSISGFAVTVFSRHNCIHSTTLFPYCNGSSALIGPLITLMSLNSSLSDDDNTYLVNNYNMSRLEQYGFENLTDVVDAYFA